MPGGLKSRSDASTSAAASLAPFRRPALSKDRDSRPPSRHRPPTAPSLRIPTSGRHEDLLSGSLQLPDRVPSSLAVGAEHVDAIQLQLQLLAALAAYRTSSVEDARLSVAILHHLVPSAPPSLPTPLETDGRPLHRPPDAALHSALLSTLSVLSNIRSSSLGAPLSPPLPALLDPVLRILAERPAFRLPSDQTLAILPLLIRLSPTLSYALDVHAALVDSSSTGEDALVIGLALLRRFEDLPDGGVPSLRDAEQIWRTSPDRFLALVEELAKTRPNDAAAWTLLDSLLDVSNRQLERLKSLPTPFSRRLGSTARPADARAPLVAVVARSEVVLRRNRAVEENLPLQVKILEAYSLASSFKEVWRLWDSLEAALARPTGVPEHERTRAYEIYFGACGFARDLDRAKSTWRSLLSFGRPIDVTIYHAYSEALARGQDWPAVLSLLLELRTSLLLPNPTPAILARMLSRASKHPPRVLTVFGSSRTIGSRLSPDEALDELSRWVIREFTPSISAEALRLYRGGVGRVKLAEDVEAGSGPSSPNGVDETEGPPPVLVVHPSLSAPSSLPPSLAPGCGPASSDDAIRQRVPGLEQASPHPPVNSTCAEIEIPASALDGPLYDELLALGQLVARSQVDPDTYEAAMSLFFRFFPRSEGMQEAALWKALVHHSPARRKAPFSSPNHRLAFISTLIILSRATAVPSKPPQHAVAWAWVAATHGGLDLPKQHRVNVNIVSSLISQAPSYSSAMNIASAFEHAGEVVDPDVVRAAGDELLFFVDGQVGMDRIVHGRRIRGALENPTLLLQFLNRALERSPGQDAPWELVGVLLDKIRNRLQAIELLPPSFDGSVERNALAGSVNLVRAFIARRTSPALQFNLHVSLLKTLNEAGKFDEVWKLWEALDPFRAPEPGAERRDVEAAVIAYIEACTASNNLTLATAAWNALLTSGSPVTPEICRVYAVCLSRTGGWLSIWPLLQVMRLSPTLPSPDPVILAGVLDSAESHPPSLSAVPSDPSSPPPSEDLVDASPKSKIMLWMKAEFSSCYKEAVGLHQANSWDSTKEEFAAKREDYMELFSVQAPEAPPPLPPLLRTGNDYLQTPSSAPPPNVLPFFVIDRPSSYRSSRSQPDDQGPSLPTDEFHETSTRQIRDAPPALAALQELAERTYAPMDNCKKGLVLFGDLFPPTSRWVSSSLVREYPSYYHRQAILLILIILARLPPSSSNSVAFPSLIAPVLSVLSTHGDPRIPPADLGSILSSFISLAPSFSDALGVVRAFEPFLRQRTPLVPSFHKLVARIDFISDLDEFFALFGRILGPSGERDSDVRIIFNVLVDKMLVTLRALLRVSQVAFFPEESSVAAQERVTLRPAVERLHFFARKRLDPALFFDGWVKVASAQSLSGQYEDGRRTFEEVLVGVDGPSADWSKGRDRTVAFVVYFDNCGYSGSLAALKASWTRITTSGHAINLNLCSAYCEALMRNADWATLFQLFSHMKASSHLPSPDSHIINSFLSGLRWTPPPLTSIPVPTSATPSHLPVPPPTSYHSEDTWRAPIYRWLVAEFGSVAVEGIRASHAGEAATKGYEQIPYGERNRRAALSVRHSQVRAAGTSG